MQGMNERRRRKLNRRAELMLRLPKAAEKFADKLYNHRRMFGEIIDPAFRDDIAARLRLIDTLELMMRGRLPEATKKLYGLHEFCRSDADFAAWYFFTGVLCEKCGMTEPALFYYGESAKCDPEFYMVYLQLAKCLHTKKRYEGALNAYITALDEVLSRPKRDEVPAVREDALLGSIHANAANCLLMMRRYDDAEFELYEAERYGCEDPMLWLTWATLYAATGRRAQASERMSRLRAESPELEAASALRVREVIEQRNSRFALRSIPTDKLKAFWDWFSENEGMMHTLAVGAGSQLALDKVYEQMCNVFDFGTEKPGLSFGLDGEKARLSFYDNYNLTFEIWLERLVDTAPKQLRQRWSFYSVH